MDPAESRITHDDHMIAGLDNPFDGEVESVGAIEREDPPLGGCTMEELVEGVPRRPGRRPGKRTETRRCRRTRKIFPNFSCGYFSLRPQTFIIIF